MLLLLYHNCDGTDFKMGVAATLPELSEWTLRVLKKELQEPPFPTID